MIADYLITHPILSRSLLGLVALSAIAFSLWIGVQLYVDENIYPYVYIDDIPMGNLSSTQAKELLIKRDDYYNQALIIVMYKDIPIATFSGEQLALKRDTDARVEQAYMIGRSDHVPSRIAQQINGIFHIREFRFTTGIAYNMSEVNEFVAQAEESYNVPPKDALFQFEDGKVKEFKEHENGSRIMTEVFIASVDKEIQSITPEHTSLSVTLQEEVVEPEITLAQANDLGIEELIGQGVSDYSHSIPSRIHNVLLAANKFNGILIKQGATFSFNDIIGDISANTGYQSAYVIKDGKTVLGDGGGVCQVSTTMFRAALNTGLPIVDRTAHAYRVGYYENDSEPGFDATIYTPSVDFKFVNDTPRAILVQTDIDTANNILTFNFYGKKDNRTVELSPVTIWDVAPAPEAKYQDDPTLPAGVTKQIDFAASGAKTKFEYKVFSADGNVMQDEIFYSTFRPWAAVFLRGTGESI